ncbi:helix-turn-helix domain-containing protein [Parolsenella sp. LCP21S3_E11]|uniref:helix-turn-helix domain-containing protein n=1 Tax=Parolsenella sp. LCP21S3_E11 TaxID=3438797 RepID=UPI003F9C0A4D
MNDSGNALMTVNRVAEVLGVSNKTVYRMIADGQLKAVRIRNAWRISADELKRVVAYAE